MGEKKLEGAGLRGQVAGKTALSTVGKEGKGLTYRGYAIEELAEKASFEYALAFTGVENLTAKYIYSDYGGSSESKQTLWASYQIGKLLAAAEIAKHDNASDVAANDEDGWLIMGNYSITDPLSITLRYSNVESKGATVADTNKFTISPTYMITDDLAFLAEYSDISGTDNDFIGLELIYTF